MPVVVVTQVYVSTSAIFQDSFQRCLRIHPAPRGVAAHTAGYFSSYTLNSSALL